MYYTYRRPLEPQQVARVSNVKYKSFHSAAEAQAWLQGIVDAMAPTAPPHDPSISQEQSGYEAEQAQLRLQPRDPLYCGKFLRHWQTLF